MLICLFDTETTGLLKPSPAGLDQQPYIIELYACIVDENFKLQREFETFLNVDFPLEDIIKKITNITDEMLVGQPKFAEIADKFAEFMTGVDAIVAHNLNFDSSMLANELIRCDRLIKFPWPRHHICTVERTMGLKGYRLKLSDLHKEVTGKDFADAHRAKNDVHALVRAFRGLVDKGIIDLENL